jgi:hypothetical protein
MREALVRSSRFIRSPQSGSLYFTPRDLTILHALYKYHLLSTHQLVAIHQGSEQKTRWRLRELFDAGYVQRFNTKVDATIPGSEPIVYALTDRGADWLSEHRPDIERQHKRYNENNARRTRSSIPHGLMVADIMVRFELASYYRPDRVRMIGQHEVLQAAPERTRTRRTPTHWNSPATFEGASVTVGNNPDQVFGIIDHERPVGRETMHFFLEADRGTESVRPTKRHLNKSTIYRKLIGYLNTKRTNLYQQVFGAAMENFRVLWVVVPQGRDRDGKTRLENFLAAAHAVTEGRLPNLFLFTTYDAFKQDDPLEHEWVNIRGETVPLIR